MFSNSSLFLPVIEFVDKLDNQVNISIRIPTNLRYFDGHFPVGPILPGVVQTDWVLHFVKRYLACSGEFSGFRQLKFQRVIGPGNRLVVRLVLFRDRNELEFSYTLGADTYSSGKILLRN